MKALTYILRISLCFQCLVLSSQSSTSITCRGTVQSIEGSMLEHVLVVGYSGKTLVTFTESNDSGHYQLIMPQSKDSMSLSFQYLGYEDYIVPFLSRGIKHEFIFNATLNPQNNILQEVVIQDKEYGIQENGDVITIKPEKYIDSTEVVLEDLLMKIPGIDVSDQGTISVNGRAIKKILIDGDNLLDNQYKLISKTLNASLVDDIQVLTNFVDNDLYKGFVDSDDVALNVRLKESAKAVLIGSGTLGYGSMGHRAFDGNLGTLGKKIKFFSTFNHNDISDNIDQLLEGQQTLSIEDFLRGSLWKQNSSESFVNIHRLYSINIPMRYYIQNNTLLTSLSSFFKAPANTVVTARLIVGKDDDFQESVSRQSFRGQSGVFTFQETNTQVINDARISGYLLTNTPLGPQQSLEFKTEINRNDLQTNRTAIISQESLHVAKEKEGNVTDVQLRYTNKLSKNTLATIQSYYILSTSQDHIEADKFPLIELPEPAALTQEVSPQQQTSGIVSTYRKTNFPLNMVVQIGIEERKESVKSNAQMKQSGGVDLSRFSNDINLRLLESYLRFENSLDIKKWRISFSNRLMHTVSTLRTEVLRDRQSKVYTVPHVGIAHSVHPFGKLQVSYTYEIESSRLSRYHAGYIISDYRNVSSGGSGSRFLRRHNINLRQDFNNWEDEYLISSSLSYGVYDKSWNIISDVNSEVTEAKSTVGNGDEFILGNISLIKYLKPINGTLKLAGSHTRLSNTQVINVSELRNINSQSKLELKVQMTFGKISNTFSGQVFFNQNRNTSSSSDNRTNYTATSFKNSMKITTNKKLSSVALSVERFTNSSFSDSVKYYGSFSLFHKIPRSRLIITADIVNIFNATEYLNTINSATFNATSIYDLQDRYFLFRVKYIL